MKYSILISIKKQTSQKNFLYLEKPYDGRIDKNYRHLLRSQNCFGRTPLLSTSIFHLVVDRPIKRTTVENSLLWLLRAFLIKNLQVFCRFKANSHSMLKFICLSRISNSKDGWSPSEEPVGYVYLAMKFFLTSNGIFLVRILMQRFTSGWLLACWIQIPIFF